MMLAMTTPSRFCDSSFCVSSFAAMHRLMREICASTPCTAPLFRHPLRVGKVCLVSFPNVRSIASKQEGGTPTPHHHDGSVLSRAHACICHEFTHGSTRYRLGQPNASTGTRRQRSEFERRLGSVPSSPRQFVQDPVTQVTRVLCPAGPAIF